MLEEEFNKYDIVEYKFSPQNTTKTAILTERAVGGWWAMGVLVDDVGNFSWDNSINTIWLYPVDIIKVIG